MEQKFELKGHSYQIADTGDYDGCYEITNGKISVFTKDEYDDGSLQKVVDALNESGCSFYLDDTNAFLAYHFEGEAKRLQTELDTYRAALEKIKQITLCQARNFK
jgi:hypothetical protein